MKKKLGIFLLMMKSKSRNNHFFLFVSYCLLFFPFHCFSDMEEWMKAINGHIHVTYLQENKLTGKDYWDQGQVALSLWKVPAPNSASTARRPVGIRSVPHVDGPRTGEGLFPGDVIEVVQTIEDKETNQKYLRLADDRGWVFENHPVVSFHLTIKKSIRFLMIFLLFFYLGKLCNFNSSWREISRKFENI